MNYIVRLASTPTRNEMKIDIFSDNDWAGCPTTRKSTTGFVVQFAGTTVRFGARTQSIVALSSAKSELYAIDIGAAEALHVRNFLLEACPQAKVYNEDSHGLYIRNVNRYKNRQQQESKAH